LSCGEFNQVFSKVTTMSKISIFLLFASSTLAAQAFFGTAVATDASNAPLEQVNHYNNEVAVNDALAQVTSVNQLLDVQPTDWAFQALQSLVERYGCIAGYPDGSYRGNRALNRYEFAECYLGRSNPHDL